VAERLNAPVSKTGMGYQSIGGSNPPLSVDLRPLRGYAAVADLRDSGLVARSAWTISTGTGL
jgi:hypothetical protein